MKKRDLIHEVGISANALNHLNKREDPGLFPAAGLCKPVRCTPTLRYGESSNAYPLWIYPDEEPSCPSDVLECRVLDGRARQVLAAGGKVFLAPDS
ncbi:MAG: hypothetical protein IKQ45_08545 [Clostridia bacterium]|nr:hypothetical protein [Clostridia bacterium]